MSRYVFYFYVEVFKYILRHKGTSFVPIEFPTDCWNALSPNTT